MFPAWVLKHYSKNEFVIVGLVPTIAQQLAVSLPSAGMLVSIYALGVAIGAPVLTV
ncbi:hypothetical protein MJM83_30900, partial [Salmonella enterica subsp. enterica serovar Montevideo]|nr:hypothetical protein [Salmonella enterica subsp. enterica serovar Montevideo]